MENNSMENNLEQTITNEVNTKISRDGFVYTYVELPKTLVDRINSREDLSTTIINSMVDTQDDLEALLGLSESQIEDNYLGDTFRYALVTIGIARTIDKVYSFNDLENNTRLFMTAINNSKFTKLEKEILRIVVKTEKGLDVLYNSIRF